MGKLTTQTRVITSKLTVLPICMLLAFAGSVLASNPAEDFKNLLVEETEYFTLQDFEFDEENMFLKAEYLYKPLDKPATLYLEYGEHENISDIASRFSTIGEVAQTWDTGDIYSDMSRSERRVARSHFDEVVSNADIFKWQKNHGSLYEEISYLEAFPLETANASLQRHSQGNSTEIRTSYDLKTSDRSISLNVQHGESGRQAGNRLHCGDPDIVEIASSEFYESQGSRSYSLRHLDDDVLITVAKSYDGGGNQEEMNQSVRDFAAELDIDRFNNQTYPGLDGPGDGIPFVQLESSDFEALFPEQMGENLTLQGVESYDNAMHVRADYLYEPEDHIVGVHLAYGDYANTLQTGLRIGNVGSFRSQYEVGCLEDQISEQDYNNLREALELPAESEITKWEMENIDYSEVNPLVAYFPLEFEGYRIESIRPDADDLEVVGEYYNAEEDQTMNISARYGDSAIRQYHRYQLLSFGDQIEKHAFDVGGRTFFGVESRGDFYAHNFTDNLMIEAGTEVPDGMENPHDLATPVGEFITAFNTEPFYNWEPPEDFTVRTPTELGDGTPICFGTDCMEEKLTACEPAAFGGRMDRRLEVAYKIVEPAGDQCRISMEYIRNPNDEWIEQPLYFSMDRDADFADTVQEAVKECMEGRTDAYDCGGPLLELLE